MFVESSDPVKKLTFEFRQPPSEFTMHPQIKPTSRVPEVTGVVANQPRLFIPKGDASRSSRGKYVQHVYNSNCNVNFLTAILYIRSTSLR